MLRLGLFYLLLSSLAQQASANCYYPNGALSNLDAPCSPSGGACCPLNWQCLSNGLCYLPNANYTGRYTCTDQTWQSDSCPQFCTKGKTATGNEAILQCSSSQDSYCCDGDRSFNCCEQKNTDFFSVAFGSAIASISYVPSPTSAVAAASSKTKDSKQTSTAQAQSSAASSQPQTSAAPASSAPAASSTAAASSNPSTVQSVVAQSASSAPATSAASGGSSGTAASASATGSQASAAGSVITSVTSGASGVQTVFITTSPTALSTSNPAPTRKSNLPTIIGCAVGIPLGIILLLLIAFLLWRRRRNTRRAPQSSPSSHAAFPPDPVDRKDNRASEIDSHPVGLPSHMSEIDGQRLSPVKGRSELPGDVPATPASVTSSMGTAPPGYSPGMARGRWSTISGGGGGVGGGAQGYVPYRPPAAELPG